MTPLSRPAAGARTSPSEETAMTEAALPGTAGPYDPTGEVIPVRSNRRSASRLWARWLEPASLVPTYVGIVVIAVGFALIGIAWARIAALTDVALQMPYLVSAGFTGLALVMVGLIIVNVAAKRQDSAERTRQLQTLAETFQSLQAEIARLQERGRRR
jgi:hypothetical protein